MMETAMCQVLQSRMHTGFGGRGDPCAHPAMTVPSNSVFYPAALRAVSNNA